MITFFEDFKIDKSKTIGICNIHDIISTKIDSHKFGHSKILQTELSILGYTAEIIKTVKDDYSKYDLIIIDLGAEYHRHTNYFGGIHEKYYNHFLQLQNFLGEIIFWKIKPVIFQPKIDKAISSNHAGLFEGFKNTSFNKLYKKVDDARCFKYTYKTDKLLYSDSHGAAIWDPSYMYERKDGRTLMNSFKKYPVTNVLNDFKESGINLQEIKIQIGNIDIRHHAFRTLEPGVFIEKAIRDFHRAIQYLPKIVWHEPMGIEHESRKMPQTAYYKGEPYFGTWDQRNVLRKRFIEIISELNKVTVEKYPMDFFNEKGELKFEVMEKPHSIHISPRFYKWNFLENKFNW